MDAELYTPNSISSLPKSLTLPVDFTPLKTQR